MTPLMLRILGRDDVLRAGGGDFAAAVADVADGLAALRDGRAEMPAETSVSLGTPPTRQARAYALPARIGALAGVKWTAHRPIGTDPARAVPPAIVSMTLLSDAVSGLPLALVESALLTAMRTAAVSALALRHAAPLPVRTVTVLGAGMQARTHLRMLAALFPRLAAVTLWNRQEERARALVASFDAPWKLRVEAGLDAAIDGADAVLACTSALEPFLRPDHFAPGRMLVQIGYHEASFDAIDRADFVLVDLWGEFRLNSAKSLFQMHRAGRFELARVAANLGSIVLDGWRPPEQAAVYMSCFGLNVFDIALAARIFRIAHAAGLGQVAPLSCVDGNWKETMPHD
jgi:ornithine cyclodeaminase